MKIYINDWKDFKHVMWLVGRMLTGFFTINVVMTEDAYWWLKFHLTTEHKNLDRMPSEDANP